MLIKIDLEKAYDRLSWSFIRDTLEKLGVPNTWIMNIMNCVETTRMSVLWNGKKLDWFKPTKGIRQGDAISPFLFVLCIERLGHIINQPVNAGKWKPINLSKRGPPVSPLFFADHLLFAEASEHQMAIIWSVWIFFVHPQLKN